MIIYDCERVWRWQFIGVLVLFDLLFVLFTIEFENLFFDNVYLQFFCLKNEISVQLLVKIYCMYGK